MDEAGIALREFFIWSEQRHGAAFHAPGGIQQATTPGDAQPRALSALEKLHRRPHPLIDAQLREKLRATLATSPNRRVASGWPRHFINELRLPETWGAAARVVGDRRPSRPQHGQLAYLAGVAPIPAGFGGGSTTAASIWSAQVRPMTLI